MMKEIIKETKYRKTLSDVFAEVFNKLKKILGGGKSKIVSDTSAQQISDTITIPGRNKTPQEFIYDHNGEVHKNNAEGKMEIENFKNLFNLTTKTSNLLKNNGNPSMVVLVTIGPNYGSGLPHTWRGCGRITREELKKVVKLYCDKNHVKIPEYRNQNSSDVYKNNTSKTAIKPTAKLDGRTE